jgi:AcrR family transcriptional regulator
MANASISQIDLESKGDQARNDLLQAGLHLFGENGFKATTTRMLAQHAGGNLAAIPYYFGGKEELYQSVIEYIADHVSEKIRQSSLNPRLLNDVASMSDEDALKALTKLVSTFVFVFLENKEIQTWVQIITKEQMKPTVAFDYIYEKVMKPAHELASALVAKLIDEEPESSLPILKTHMLFGQIFTFLTTRELLLRRLKAKELKAEHLTIINVLLGEHIQACLKK